MAEGNGGTATAESPSPEFVAQLAETVATLISAKSGGVANPEVSVLAAEGGVVDLSLGGTVTIAIKINNTVYALSVTVKSGEYSFKLTSQVGEEDPVPLASFMYKSTTDWSVVLNIPPIKISDTFAIEKVSVEIGSKVS